MWMTTIGSGSIVFYMHVNNIFSLCLNKWAQKSHPGFFFNDGLKCIISILNICCLFISISYLTFALVEFGLKLSVRKKQEKK